MRAKLIALVLSVAGVASSLLAVRQQRIEAAHDLAMTHREIMRADESLLRLRAAIGARTEPGRVRALAAGLGETEPILLDWCAPGEVVMSGLYPPREAQMRIYAHEMSQSEDERAHSDG